MTTMKQRLACALAIAALAGTPAWAQDDGGSTSNNGSGGSNNTGSGGNGSNGGGAPVSEETRNQAEQQMGADLSGVSIHSDADATDATDSMGAKSFSTGSDIYLGAGQYDPTQTGDRMLAHELVHSLQQTGAQQTQSEDADDGDDDAAKDDASTRKKVDVTPSRELRKPKE